MPTNPPDRLQACLWQAENYVIWVDGVSIPLFFDGSALTRSRLTPASTKINAGSGWTRPPVGQSAAIVLTDTFAGGSGVAALIGGYQYLLTQVPGSASNTVTLREKFVGASPADTAGAGIFADPSYVGDTTNLSPPSQIAFVVPKVNLPATTIDPVDLPISLHLGYTPGTGGASFTNVALRGLYTPAGSTDSPASVPIRSTSSIAAASGTLAYNNYTFSASVTAGIYNPADFQWHSVATVHNYNKNPQSLIPANQFMTFNGQTVFNDQAWTPPAPPVATPASPNPSIYTTIPTTGYMTINGVRYQYTLSPGFTDNGAGTVSATAHLFNNTAATVATTAGATFYSDSGATLQLGTSLAGGIGPPTSASPLPATVKAAVSTAGNVTIGGISYPYTCKSTDWTDPGAGTLSGKLTLANYNGVLHGSVASTGTFVLAGYTFILDTTIPAVTTISGTTPAQTFPVDAYVDSPCSGVVSPAATLAIGANTYSVVSVSDQSPGSHLVLYNTTNSNIGSEVAIATPVTFAASRGQRVQLASVHTNFSPPGVGLSVPVTIDAAYTGLLGVNVFVGQTDRYKLTAATNSSGSPIIYAQNVNDTSAASDGTAYKYPDQTIVQYGAPQLPVARLGVYGMGRNWLVLPDGKSYLASDMVGDSSGTLGLGFRDAVLNMTENTFIKGGGAFRVPDVAQIRALIFVATLDASLGQGPLQVLTPNLIFSCNAPVDRTTWQSLTNPIQTVSLISNGGLSHWATVMANGDLITRALDGLRSLILARQEFTSWGNVPMSREVQPTLDADDKSLLQFTSAIVFDNRLLLTANPVSGPLGVYHDTLVALNFDPLSSLRGKAPAVYDGLWTGLNVLKLVKGTFAGVERAFAFAYNPQTQLIELWEILPSGAAHLDNGTGQITWLFASPVLDFGQKDPRSRSFLRLADGEMYLDDIQGPLSIQAFFRPDYDTAWHPWNAWSVPASPPYQPRMGLGEPPTDADPATNRPWREGYSFQVRFIIQGHAIFKGARFRAFKLPEPKFAPLIEPN